MNFNDSSIEWLTRLGLMLTVCLLASCDQAPSAVSVSGETMGTTWSVKVVSDDVDASELQRLLDDRLIALNDVFSTYLPQSELSRLNQKSGISEISDELRLVLDVSQDIYQLSEGAFDVTVGPLVNLWGFGPEGPSNGVPSVTEIKAAMGNTGYSRVTVEGNRLNKPEGLVIDLSAVAKGYAVDELAEILESLGLARYLVEIGGEVKTRGLNDRNQPWVIGIEAPDMEIRRLYATIPVTDQGMATSGDYRNYFTHKGEVYSHTLNPKTGWPVQHNFASVTVLHDSAAYADGFATAFSVLGLDRTLAIAEANNLKVFAIIRGESGFESKSSTAMDIYLEKPQ
ncbi:MAG: FAD:protein FMN transferase [Pseudomonadales bacterium]|nr:FAD:protein FMN transferase [Pseudomonadales bacterium]